MKNKLIKSILIFAAWAIPVLLLAWFAYTLIQNTKTQPQEKNQEIQITVNFNNKPVEGTETVETTRQVPVVCPFTGEVKTSEVKSVVKTTKNESSEQKVVITEDAFKETMQQVAYTARQEAQNEYDKNFATLLTILTIFGIAWPVIIALLQFKFNESDLKEIKNDLTKANKTLSKAKDARKMFEKNCVILGNNLITSLDFISLGIKDNEMICLLRISVLNCVVNKLQLCENNSENSWKEILNNVKLIKTEYCTSEFAQIASNMLFVIYQKMLQIENDNSLKNILQHKKEALEKIETKRLELHQRAARKNSTKNTENK